MSGNIAMQNSNWVNLL